MKFTIFGQPISKQRPRFYKRGRHVGVFDVQEKQKILVRSQLHHQMAANRFNLVHSTTFACRMSFHISMPNSWPEAKKNEKLWHLSPCDYKCDLDNLEKFYLDCMNGIVIPDDHLIVDLQSTKQYSLTPKTEIDIMPIKELSISNQARGILQIFGPDKLVEFISDVHDLFDLYDVDEKVDEIVNAEVGGNLREIRLASTAIALSKVADKHAKAFKKINGRYPDFWKKCHRIASDLEKNDVLENPPETC